MARARPASAAIRCAIWRATTARHGVALFLHDSGVFDAEAVRQHPGWARRDAAGKTDDKNTSVFGPYVDKLLIPQFRELAEVYGVEGVWVDGECWSVAPDWSARAVAGLRRVPAKPGAPGWYEFLEHNRAAFRRYLRHYVDELHRLVPQFQLASNWAFTTFMPEPITANVDFLSGDYSALNAVNTAGPHADERVYVHEEIPPVGPLAIRIRLPARPRRITRQPAGQSLRFVYRQGVAEVKLPRLAIHDILVVER